MTLGEPILSIRNLTKRFGGILAVDGATFDVDPGLITGLIGPNGAGKSTLFNVIIGFYTPDAGEVWFDGHRIDGLPPYQIVKLGIAMTFQIPREFDRLTVLENLMVAARMPYGERLSNVLLRPWKTRQEQRETIQRATEILETMGLRPLRDEYAGNLSGGQKKLLELARALMTDPKLILLDEPVAGINPTLTNELLELIEGLRDAGKTFFLVEHDMDVVMGHTDHIIVLHEGRRLTEGTPEEIKMDPQVIDSYLGG